MRNKQHIIEVRTAHNDKIESWLSTLRSKGIEASKFGRNSPMNFDDDMFTCRLYIPVQLSENLKGISIVNILEVFPEFNSLDCVTTKLVEYSQTAVTVKGMLSMLLDHCLEQKDVDYALQSWEAYARMHKGARLNRANLFTALIYHFQDGRLYH